MNISLFEALGVRGVIQTKNVTNCGKKGEGVSAKIKKSLYCKYRLVLTEAGFLMNLFSKFRGPKIRIFGGNSEGIATYIRL